MEDIKLYSLAREQIENSFIGLPCASSRIIQLLITRANPYTGIVDNLTYRDLAKLLIVDHAPGRKGAGIPKIETIRSYLRTVAKSCSNDFRIISDGQKLKFQFLNMPKIYAFFFDKKEVYREESDDCMEEKSIKSMAQIESLELSNTLENKKLATAVFFQKPVKNINIFKITKTNKLTNTQHSKKPIDDNFYPNTTTIEQALSMGLNKVLDQDEIDAFIQHNKKNCTQWADFNPVFITWLERGDQYTNNKQQKAHRPRNNHNERGRYQNTLYPEALMRVSELHGIEIESIWGNPSSEPGTSALIEGTLIQPLDTTDWNLRGSFHL